MSATASVPGGVLPARGQRQLRCPDARAGPLRFAVELERKPAHGQLPRDEPWRIIDLGKPATESKAVADPFSDGVGLDYSVAHVDPRRSLLRVVRISLLRMFAERASATPTAIRHGARHGNRACYGEIKH